MKERKSLNGQMASDAIPDLLSGRVPQGLATNLEPL